MIVTEENMRADPPVITIVIGTYNRLASLKKCLQSIARETSVPYVVEVSDAGSTDGTVEFLQAAAGPQLRVTFEKEKIGQAKALNAVFRRLDTPYTCWLSDDNEVVNKGIDIAVAALDEHPSFGMIGLKVRDRAGPFIALPYIGGVTATGVININQGVLRLSAFKAVGYFSEHFGTYGIDPDLTTKILLAGYDIALTREISVMHDRDWAETGLDDPSHPFKQSSRYHALYWKKYGAWMGSSLRWFLSRAFWKVLRVVFPHRLSLENTNPLFGFLVRDWHNFFSARFVSLSQELTNRDGGVYQRQHCTAALVAKGVPEDGKD